MTRLVVYSAAAIDEQGSWHIKSKLFHISKDVLPRDGNILMGSTQVLTQAPFVVTAIEKNNNNNPFPI